MNKLLAAIFAISYFIVASASADTLSFASPLAGRASLHTEVFEPWIEKIVAESEGELTIRSFHSSPLGNYNNMYDRVLDGVVDIAFTTTAQVGGQFRHSDVAALPIEASTSYESSVALWKLYESGLISHEYSDIKLLGLFVFPSAALHMRSRSVRTLEDLSRAKIRTAGKLQSDMLARLGGSPVTATPSDIYQGLNRGVFDGAIMPWTGVEPFKLDEVTRFHLNAALGSSVAMVFMNIQAFDELPQSAQLAIENNSGLSLSMLLAQHADRDAANIEYAVSQHPDQIIEQLEPDEAERWHAVLQPLVDEWSSKEAGNKEILAAFREQVRILREAENR